MYKKSNSNNPRKPKMPKSRKPKNIWKTIGFWTILAIFTLVITSSMPSGNLKEVPISEVIARANEGEISKLQIQDNRVLVTLEGQDRPTEFSFKDSASSIHEQGLKVDAPVTIEQKPASNTRSIILDIAIMVIPMIIVVAFLSYMMKQAQGQNNQAMGFGKSKARVYGRDQEKVNFSDIAGNDNAKQDLTEVVDFLKNPEKYRKLGAKIPKGVLLVGNPGTGKTMLARAVAGEANVPFFSISGSEFVEMFVGVGASRVRDLFDKAKKNAPAIIFIDEIDAVGRRRGSGLGGGHDEREQTLNQILVEMDGFETDANVIILAATNRADVLDPALLRPGRFDRRVTINLPERRDRLAILKVHYKNKPMEDNVDLDALAAKTAGSSGADLANIANESAIIAASRDHKKITQDDVTEAFEKVAIGPERKSTIMSDKERELTAYHEAGHAVVGQVLPDSDEVHKVTIIPRGATGGVTWFIPPEDRHYTNVYEYKDMLARAMGGRQAERLIYGDDGITTGAGMDLRSATTLAREMVTEQGMAEGLRDQVFHEDGSNIIFDKMTTTNSYSEVTAQKIDAEVAKIMKEAADRAYKVLVANKKLLETLAKTLLEKETLEAEEVAEILKDAKLPAEVKLRK
ncbi:MAG: ATP-dependent zinc metalloprotease FtsH [Candidatus Nanosyncoccaceae bacterium]|jgi:cell division protease FtsH